MRFRRTHIVLAGCCGAAVAAVVAFPSLCRGQVARVAERYGATVDVEAVAPTWRGVRLRGVDVSLSEVPSIRVHLEEVEVLYGPSGRRVVFRGGAVAAVGAPETVVHQVEAWRASHLRGADSTAADGGKSGGTELAGVRVSWASSSGQAAQTLVAEDVRIERSDGHVVLAAREARATSGESSIVVKDGRIGLVRRESGYGVGELAASEVSADLVVPPPAPSAPEDRPVEPPPPPRAPAEATGSRAGGHGPVAGKRGRGQPRQARSVEPVPAPVPSAHPVSAPSAVSIGAGYRARLLNAVAIVDRALEPDARVRLDGVRARLHRHAEVLNLGPGTVRLDRSDGKLVVELVPGAPPADTGPSTAPGEALTFRLSAPLGDAPGEIAVDLNGGPIWLSALGVREGDFGLFDVGETSLSTRSHLVLAADGQTLRVDGEAKLRHLSIRSAALSDEPVAGLEAAMRLKGEVDVDGKRARIADAEVDLGAIRFLFHGDYDHVAERAPADGGLAEGARVRGSFDLPLTACQSMLDAIPKGLVPKLQGTRLAGSYALRGHVDLDTNDLDRHFALDWDASNTCRVVEAPPEISVERFKHPFKRAAYDSEGRPVIIETGPGTPEWVPTSARSKFMEVAVLTTEDGGFPRHHGFDHEAIRNSIRENLRRRRFVRGASTISMQLAKNLYLDRGKNLSRKLQEAVLTMYLEQELTKDQILELYFNVVEFGPMVYGIGPAARYYYNAAARELSLSQALYLSSIMPNPKVQHFGAGGAVAEGWMNLLHRLMKISHGRRLITDEELEEGLHETVIRGSPTPARSAKTASDLPAGGRIPNGDDGDPAGDGPDTWAP